MSKPTVTVCADSIRDVLIAARKAQPGSDWPKIKPKDAKAAIHTGRKVMKDFSEILRNMSNEQGDEK